MSDMKAWIAGAALTVTTVTGGGSYMIQNEGRVSALEEGSKYEQRLLEEIRADVRDIKAQL